MSKVLDWFIDLIFPNRCSFCGRFIAWNELICKECDETLTRAEFCPRCGKIECECGSRSYDYDGCAVLLTYDGIARDGVLSLKYHNGFNTAKYLSGELADKLKACGCLRDADVITAVPMTKARRRETGYNQAEYIAKCLSKQTGIRCNFKLIYKLKSGVIQHELTAEERCKAVIGAYVGYENHKNLKGKTVILCDDIVTTGSTLSECARVLKSMGAKRVYCAVLAGSGHRSITDKSEMEVADNVGT